MRREETVGEPAGFGYSRAMISRLERLAAGMPIVFGGDRITHVSEDLAACFEPGDRLIVVQDTGDLLRAPAATHAAATRAVDRAVQAFAALAAVSDAAITDFFERFALALESEAGWAPIAHANDEDVAEARARGRATTRLIADARMRADMVAGLRAWRDAPPGRERIVETIDHAGWSVAQVAAPLGVVGFVFEGRPNVFADAAGVIRSGNTVVFRIGSDALRTARAIAAHALAPALAAAGLPPGAAVLVDDPDRAAGWALFADPRLSLAVARGSGPAVSQLGAVARQSGTPVSLHGTGGAWLIADDSADAGRFAAAVFHSLDRKVCNTLNVCCVPRARADELAPLFLDAVRRAGERRGLGARVHLAEPGLPPTPGVTIETHAALDLGHEWEWDDTPEVSFVVVDDVDEAVALFNAHSPRFVASLIANDAAAQASFYAAIDAAFVGDGFTRWVDGQFAFDRPELGLSNWQGGRLFARGGVLSGDGVYTVRTRMKQRDVDLHR
jgi:glutamate-5-semialdehyde dehydrogenase